MGDDRTGTVLHELSTSDGSLLVLVDAGPPGPDEPSLGTVSASLHTAGRVVTGEHASTHHGPGFRGNGIYRVLFPANEVSDV